MISYDNGSLVDEGATGQLHYTFNNLISNTLYIIFVLANNEAGNGSAITMIVKTTGSQGVLLNQQLHVYMCQCIIHKLQNNRCCSEIYTRNIIPQCIPSVCFMQAKGAQAGLLHYPSSYHDIKWTTIPGSRLLTIQAWLVRCDVFCRKGCLLDEVNRQ